MILHCQRVYRYNQRTENLNLVGTYRVQVESIRSVTGWIRRQGGSDVRYLGAGRWLVVHQASDVQCVEPSSVGSATLK